MWVIFRVNVLRAMIAGQFGKDTDSFVEFFVNEYDQCIKRGGDTMYGDWCEWNDITQTERVISSYMNKITYNQQIFDTSPTDGLNQNGFYYQVHYPITLKVFSDYIETAGSEVVFDGLPNYSYFSNNLKQWLWRDLYPYGYIDSLNRGVDYPFINNAHYPFENIIFRLYPEGASFDITELYQVVADPIIDFCE